MEIKAFFGILSSLFIFLGGIPYLRDIHLRKAHPHVLSWIGWAFITALGAFAMLAGGSQWAVAILLSNTLLCLLIVLYSVFKRVGVWSTMVWDFVFFGLGLLGLVLWQTLHLPILALICAIIADFSFGLPTIVKTYKDPNSETPFVWATATISGIFSLFAIRSFAFSEVAYPLYLFLYDGIVLLLVLKIFVKKNKNIRKLLDTIVNEKNEKNWYVPELFQQNTLPILPRELKVIALPPLYDENYNCFIYALGLSNNLEFIKKVSGFIYSPFVKKLIEEGVLRESKEIKKGTIILYTNEKKFPGEIAHAGVMKDKDTVISKWSWGPTLEHSLLSVPLSYGETLKFYHLESTNSVLLAYEKFSALNRA